MSVPVYEQMMIDQVDRSPCGPPRGGAHFDSSIDTAAATLVIQLVFTRSILLGNPVVPLTLGFRLALVHLLVIQSRAVPLFFSEDLGKHVVFASFTAASNQHLDIGKTGTSVLPPVMTLRCWMRGCAVAGHRHCRCLFRLVLFNTTKTVSSGLPAEDVQRAFVCMDHGIAAPSAAYLCLPEPEVHRRGRSGCSTSGTQRRRHKAASDWTRGCYLSNAEQAASMIEWLGRWKLSPAPRRSSGTRLQRKRRTEVINGVDFLAAGVNDPCGKDEPAGSQWLAMVRKCCKRRVGSGDAMAAVVSGLPGLDGDMADVAKTSKGRGVDCRWLRQSLA